MWANAQRDGALPNIARWRSLFNAAVWLTPTTTRNPLKFAGVPQTNETISAASRPKFTILSGHVEEILLPLPQIDVIGAVVIVWRVMGKTIRSVSVQYCVQQLCTVRCTHI